jgi:hypothetical protein
MAIDGNLDKWTTRFPTSLVPQIIRLVLNSWNNFSTSQIHEVPITQEFFVVLERNQEFSKLPFLPDLEVILPNENGTEQKGRLDLRFIHGYRRKVYFSIECKRLSVHFPSGFDTLASEYVTDGMYRYFNGQYAQELDKGGMLGYVMDGNIDEAIQSVKAAIENRRQHLHMESDDTLRPCSFLSSKQVKETFHNYGPTNQFVIYHIFLSVITSLNNN